MNITWNLEPVRPLLEAGAWGGLALALIWGAGRWTRRFPAFQCLLWRAAYAKLLLAALIIPVLPLPILPAATRSASGARPAAMLSAGDLAERESLLVSDLSEAPAKNRSIDLNGWVLLWALGLVGTLAAVAREGWRARALRLGSEPVHEPALQSLLLRLRARSGLKRLPELRSSLSVDSPVTVGWPRSCIILPDPLPTSNRSLELMMAHEMAHVRRRDLFWSWLLILGRVFFWFQPLVWLRNAERCAESACDLEAVRCCECAPSEFAGMLLDSLAQSRRPSLFPLQAGVFENGPSLKRRIRALDQRRTGSLGTWMAAASAGFLILALLMPWKLVAYSAPAAVSAEPASLAVRHQNAEKTGSAEESKSEKTRGEISAEDSAPGIEQIRNDIQELKVRIETARTRYSEKHPKIIALRRELAALQNNLNELLLDHNSLVAEINRLKRLHESGILSESEMNLRIKQIADASRQTEAAEKPAASTARELDLLKREFSLAEKEYELARRSHASGRASLKEVLEARREVLKLKLEVIGATPASTNDDFRKALDEELEILKSLKKEIEKKIETGVLPSGAEIPIEKEILSIERRLLKVSGSPIEGKTGIQVEIRGEVRNPGSYVMIGKRTLSVAVSMAGGFTDFARKSRITVQSSSGETRKLNWPADSETALAPGDLVMVPRSFF